MGRSPTSPAPTLRRVALLASLALVTIAAGTVVLVVVERVAARGVAIDLLGAIAAVGAIALLALAAIRRNA